MSALEQLPVSRGNRLYEVAQVNELLNFLSPGLASVRDGIGIHAAGGRQSMQPPKRVKRRGVGSYGTSHPPVGQR